MKDLKRSPEDRISNSTVSQNRIKRHGMSRRKNVRDYICEELEIDETQIRIERAHRLRSKATPKPIIVKFSFFKENDEVLKVYRQKQ